MESEATAWEGAEGAAVWPLATSGRAAEPSAAAVIIPAVLKKVRRLLLDCVSDVGLLIPPTALVNASRITPLDP
jgi:hypothetical protein